MTRPEVTVSMPARNAEPFIGCALASVLRQREVDLEVIVVEDASEDHTADVVAGIADPRVRLIRNPVRRGIAACHNIVLDHSGAPFVAHVDADDVVLSGALRRMVDLLEGDPALGQGHCYFFEIDGDSRTTVAAFRRRWEWFHATRPPGMDYRAAIMRGCVINHLRTYRRAALQATGRFNESLPYGEDYEMALRLLERFEIGLAPEFLYAYRIHGASTTESLRHEEWRLLVAQIQTWRRVWRLNENHFIRRKRGAMIRSVAARLAQLSGLRRRTAFPPNRPAAPLVLPPELIPVGDGGELQLVPAGPPRHDQERIPLRDSKSSFASSYSRGLPRSRQ